MANEAQALVEYRDDNGLQYEPCDTMDKAIVFIRSLVSNGKKVDALYQRVPFKVVIDVDVEGAPAPRRKRKDSTGTAASDGPPPVSPEKAAAPVDVRPAVATPAPAASARSLLLCGGKACEEKDGKVIHRADPSCSKFAVTRKFAR